MSRSSVKDNSNNPGTEPQSLYVVFGTEQYLKDQAIQKIRHLVVGDDDPHLAISEFGEKTELAEILDELQTLPLMGGRRLVMMVDADRFISEHRQALEKYIDHPAPDSTLLLVCNSFNANTRLYKRLAPVQSCIRCDPLKGSALIQWIIQETQEQYSKKIDSRCARKLTELIGTDLGILSNELCKLATFVGERIALLDDDIKKLIGVTREETVFAMVDAIARRDAAAALQLWDRVWRTDAAASARSIAGLAWGLRRYLEAKYRLNHGENAYQLAREFWMRPEDFQSRMKQFTTRELELQLQELYQADLNVKQGLYNVHACIEQFIIRRCAVA